MSYKLTRASWLALMVARCTGVLLIRMQPEQAYTDRELLALLADGGLNYSAALIREIGRELVRTGVIEVVS